MYHVLPNVTLQEVSFLDRRGKDDNKQNESTKQQEKCKITTTASRLANNNEISETTTNRLFSRFIFDKRCLKDKPETSSISDISVVWTHYDPRRDLEFCHINSYNQNNVNNSCQRPNLLPIQQQKQFSSQSYRLQSSKINSKIDAVNNNNNYNNHHHYNCNLCNFDCSRKILISERLLKTVRIWYLPTLKKENIIQLLNHKPNGNFILGYDSSEISAETHVNGSLLCKTNLILYVSNILIGTANHTIWIDENSYFCFDCNLLNRFKSIMSMLEYYLTNDEPKVEFKLTLPLAIAHAKTLQQLNSLSLLEQDFWLESFYNKYTNQPATQTSYRSDQELLESSKWPNSNNRSHTLDLKLISNYLNENQAHQSFENVHEPCEHIKQTNSKSKLQYQPNVKSTNQVCHYTPDIESLNRIKTNTSSSFRKNNKNDNKTNKTNSKKNKSGAIEKYKSFRDTSSTHCNNEPSCTSYSLLSKFSWPRRYLSARFKTQTIKNTENQLNESTNGQANNFNSQKFKSTPLNSSVVGPKSALPNSQSHINSSLVKVDNTNIATNNNINRLQSQALTCDSVSSLTGVLLLDNHQLTSAGKSHHAQNQRKNNDLEDTISINSCLSFFDNHLKEINERRQSKLDHTSEMNLTEVRAPGSPALNGKHQTHDSNVGKKKTASSILNSYSIGSIGSPRFLKKKFNTVDKTSPSMSPPTPPPPPPPPSSSSQSTTWKLDRSQISNEYSEPFDLFISETPKNQYKHVSSNLETSVRNKNINSINNEMLTFIKNGKTTPTDDDSAYSSCVNQSSSNNSTPKTITKNTLNRIYKTNAKKENHSADNDEDTATSSMLFSSSSCSSSSPLSSNLTKLNVAKLVLPIYSEYESVKDSLIKTPPVPGRPAMDKTSNVSEKSIEEIKNDNDLFKSTITAFDILSERCSELIELFDENKPNQEVTVSPSSTGSVSVPPPPVTITYTVAEVPVPLRCSPSSSSSSSSTTNEDSSESTSPPPLPVTAATRLVTGNYSKFLERTLTFDYLMKSSALLSSSSSLSPLASQTEPKTAVQTTNKLAPSTSHHNYLCSSGSSSSSASSSCSTSSFDDLNTNNFNSIRSLIFRMAKNERCLFGKNVSEFLNCTNKSKEQNPNTLMSNIRQFMNGIKNYLIKNITDINNLDLKLLIEKERANLDLTQILNIDSLIEDCLQSIILRPLKAKIYYLLVDWLVGDNSLILISKNIKKINEDDPEIEKYLAFKKKEHKPSAQTLKVLRNYYNRMQCEYAPLIKLKYVLFIINELLSTIKDFESALNDFGNLNIIDFLPIIIYSLSKCGMYAIQIEIDYIWNLANRQLLTNETIYYLTLMSSACYILKSIDFSQQLSQQFSSDLAATGYNAAGINSFELNSLNETTNLSYMNMGLIDVYLPDDKYQTLKVKKIPVKPNSKCKEVCYLIASKFKIYNYDDYALYYIENGAEFRVKDDERPLEIKNEKIKYNPNIKFIFKQKALNLLWPKSIENF